MWMLISTAKLNIFVFSTYGEEITTVAKILYKPYEVIRDFVCHEFSCFVFMAAFCCADKFKMTYAELSVH